MQLADTILAASSTTGGVRAILRLSGPEAWPLAKILLANLPLEKGFHADLVLPLLHPSARMAHAVLFQAPHSFTGQDIAELHLPGSPGLMRLCIDQLLHHGHGTARIAEPGEFSARA